MSLDSLTVGSILIGAALTLLVVLVLLRPLLIAPAGSATADSIEALQGQKYRLLKQIRMLDDDLEVGKIAPELYAQQRPQLVEQAARVWQQLDALETAGALAAVDDDMDARIEAAVAALRADASNETTECPQCGRSVSSSDRFCPACGTQLITDDSDLATAPTT